MLPIVRSTLQTRGYATARHYIPPSLAGVKPATAPADAALSDTGRMNRVVDAYKRMPKGNAETQAAAPKGLWGRYRAKYVDGDNASFAPIVHIILVVGLFGYTNEYLGHLSKYDERVLVD
ncbi:ATP synthase f chain, mitochondrial precursor [Dispira simplex]|nr:ATP synthase f chain, mitochondrial precursor [Dispira simplex]